MKLIAAPNRPACRVILCTCLLTTHQQGDYDKCGMWLCICGNSSFTKSLAVEGQYQCDRCHRVFDGKTGLLFVSDETRLEACK